MRVRGHGGLRLGLCRAFRRAGRRRRPSDRAGGKVGFAGERSPVLDPEMVWAREVPPAALVPMKKTSREVRRLLATGRMG
jgi:hypothetical protein